MDNGTPARSSTALATDQNALAMLDAVVHSRLDSHRAVFELSCSALPSGRAYGVVAGTEVLLDQLDGFTFGEPELTFLESAGLVSDECLEWLSRFRFAGNITGYREGDLYFAGSPVLTVEGTLGEALLLGPLTMSVINPDSSVATTASRMSRAAGDAWVGEVSGRRAGGHVGASSARAAFIGGVAFSSRLEAARRWGIPTKGAPIRTLLQAFGDESAAFERQLAKLGKSSMWPVDSADLAEGINHAIDISGNGLEMIRIEGGDLHLAAKRAREILDQRGAAATGIMVSGRLDEYSIHEMADAPIDAFIAGDRLVSGNDAQYARLHYNLVAVSDSAGRSKPLRPVADGEITGGIKDAHRVLENGLAVEELLIVRASDAAEPVTADARPLQATLVDGGLRLDTWTAHDAREHHQACLAEIGNPPFTAEPEPPAIPTRIRRAFEA